MVLDFPKNVRHPSHEVEKVQTLAEYLGTTQPAPEQIDAALLINISDPKEFADAVLNSLEFRKYIVNGLLLGELTSAIVIRLMDYAWGKPADRIEVSGRDGKPIETIRVVRVIVDARDDRVLPDDVVETESIH